MSINLFQLTFYQEQNIWKYKVIPVGISKNESDKIIDLLIYKNHYNLIKKIYKILGKQDCGYNFKGCLNSNTSENKIIKHKQQCIQKEIISIATSPESNLHWKNDFHKNPLYFRVYVDFEAYIEKEDSKAVCTKTNNFYEQNPVCKFVE